MSGKLSFSIFYTSFLPLWFLFLGKAIEHCIELHSYDIKEVIACGVIIVVFVFSCGVIRSNFHDENNAREDEYIISKVQEEKKAVSEYLLAYILPLVVFDITQWSGLLEFVLYFSLLAYLFIRHNRVADNIFLELIGFRVYRCMVTLQEKYTRETYILSRTKLQMAEGQIVKARAINNDYLLLINILED